MSKNLRPLFNARSLACIVFATAALAVNAAAFRPPAVPLVACDPYFSIWSAGDKLTDVDTTHWTGKPHRLTSMARIDGESFRLMGTRPEQIPALPQENVEVLPTRTIYTFANKSVRLTMTFTTVDLPEDMDLLSRPVTYVTWTARAIDGAKHNVSVYFDARSEIAVDTPNQAVNFKNSDIAGVKAWRVGTVEQPVLGKKGDDIRIDWGYFYVAVPSGQYGHITVAGIPAARGGYVTGSALPAPVANLQNDAQNDLVIAASLDLGPVQDNPAAAWLLLAYDDLYSIQYMRHNLRPYWRRHGWDAADLLQAAAQEYPELAARCQAFDEELMADLRQAGGDNYAHLAALAYRQCFAAGKFVADDRGQPLHFCKENHSNGCIGTSDVFYPMSPQFLLFGPTLAKSFLVPFMNYAASDRWKFPFAPHDLGTYPDANGQVYGDGEHGTNNQMPVEESGNLLCLFGAVAQMEGNAGFAAPYWKQLEQWAAYLRDKGFDPENQLCTDDFAGHLAHNVNLSAKAICGLGAFAKLCELRGEDAEAREFEQTAGQFARRLVKAADDGDHLRLALDRPGSWSQKYNLVWDRILGLNLFPPALAGKEMSFYRRNQNQYGLPLDNRETYTKLDWITWTATLTQNRSDFEALINPVIAFINTTPDRSPLTDWFQTTSARKVGFTARPVVGGVFLQMLYNRDVWQKYAGRDKTKAANWAPLPVQPKIVVIVPAADREPSLWRYTTVAPARDWMAEGFNDSSWKQGRGGFGTRDTPGAFVGTVWRTDDIWLRRTVNVSAGDIEHASAWLHHDEDTEVYINGVLAVKAGGFIVDYDIFPLTPAGRAALRPGRNVIAIHCHQTIGGQYVDFGLVNAKAN